MNNDLQKNLIEIYESSHGELRVDVRIYDDSVWLSQEQISKLFGKERSVVTKHISNIFKEGELEEAVCAKFAHTAPDGKIYKVKYYNLDMIISVGYRINSKVGTQFRRWASGILKKYLIEGYSLNREKLMKGGISELQSAIDLMSSALLRGELVESPATEIIEIIRSYSKTWDLLIKYDEESLGSPKQLHISDKEIISYKMSKGMIEDFKKQLNLSGLFGLERDNSLKGILGNIMQSFAGSDLYPSIEEKAAHLLYFVIKDHPFSDGNKRIGSLLFLLYLKLSSIKSSKMNENTLTALALLTAESRPVQKDMIIKLIMNLIS